MECPALDRMRLIVIGQMEGIMSRQQQQQQKQQRSVHCCCYAITVMVWPSDFERNVNLFCAATLKLILSEKFRFLKIFVSFESKLYGGYQLTVKIPQEIGVIKATDCCKK